MRRILEEQMIGRERGLGILSFTADAVLHHEKQKDRYEGGHLRTSTLELLYLSHAACDSCAILRHPLDILSLQSAITQVAPSPRMGPPWPFLSYGSHQSPPQTALLQNVSV